MSGRGFECGNRIGGANCQIMFHSNYLASFLRYDHRTDDRRTDDRPTIAYLALKAGQQQNYLI